MSWFVRPIKYAVSGTRYRHIEGNYDLDLAYITNRIIAMGFPGDGIEGVYRNDGQEIARFLKEKHNGHYMIWNLSEKPYGHEKFDNQVRTSVLFIFNITGTRVWVPRSS
jgi:phosphatidylinositol-3,4,5-trisphosphate 3-phosphatase/dual-specificity protein phosphatase PTEN